MKESTGTKKMQEISDAIRQGAIAFLKREYQILSFVILILTIIIVATLDDKNTFLNEGLAIGIAFVFGAMCSVLAGVIGMRTATQANVRTTNAARTGLHEALNIAFSSGSIMGLSVVSLGLIGLTVLFTLFQSFFGFDLIFIVKVVSGFGLGASSIALFARVGGGIYTKAADVGADLVGKVEKGIPEDDPRNPAVIADNVGDNVGDVAGMGADLFDSLIVNLVAAMSIGMIPSALVKVSTVSNDLNLTFFYPIFVVCAGLIGSIIGTFFCKTGSPTPSKALTNAFLVTCVVMLAIVFGMNSFFFIGYNIALTVMIGVIAGIGIGKVTEYYTSYDHKPVREIAESSKIGAATNIIHGLSVGKRSTFGVVAVLMLAIFISNAIAGLYGIAIAGVGMLGLAAIVMAIDVYGPIVDNAGGIAEMTGLDKKVRERTDKLDAAGNTTAAIGKGFAIGSAALAAAALLHLFAEEAGIVVSGVNILEPIVLIGLFIGALVPFMFSSYVLMSVGEAAVKVAEEVRRQFRTTKGIMEGEVEPDYDKCIEIATTSALKEMIIPGLIVILTPIAVGFVLGPKALGASLVGTLVTGILLGIKQSNSGGAWDNAKKYVEKGNLGGKGSPTHHATIVGDTVGDPNKDSSGPSLNIVIKLTILVATVFVTFF